MTMLTLSRDRADDTGSDCLPYHNTDTPEIMKTLAIESIEGAVKHSLAQFLRHLDNTDAPKVGHVGLASLASDGNFDPLTYAEVVTLGCGLTFAARHEHFSSADVLDYVLDNFPRPLALSVIYRSFAKLLERGLIDKIGSFPNRSTHKPADFFEVNLEGRRAFLLAMINHLTLMMSRSKAA